VVKIAIRSSDRPALLAHITSAIAEERSNILNVEARTLEGGQGVMSLNLEVSNVGHLENILERLRGIDGIHSVERQFHTTEGPTRGG
jgi:GTP pyrophosphokinase